MKKNLTITKLARSNLKVRKKQYILLITGIILAVIFSSGVLFFISCLTTSNEMILKEAYGAQDAVMYSSNEEAMSDAAKQGLVDKYGFAHIIGYAYSDEKGRDFGSPVGYLDNTAMELSYISFISGGYPKNDNEIAVEKAALSQMGISAKVGDTITLNELTQNGSETASKPVKKSYKIVGIADNKRSNLIASNLQQETDHDLPAIFVKQGTQTQLGGKEKLVCYFNINYSREDSYDSLIALFEEHGISQDSWELSGYKNAGYARSMGDMQTSIEFAVLFVLILLAASCMGIINAFSANLDDRKKQIGLFRTVGATKRQIIKIFATETFIITLICVPIGIVLSYLIVKLITYFMGDKFVFIPDWRVLILCALFSTACVMFAAMIPIIKASKISPMQSIRNIKLTRRMKSKALKTQKSFNVSSLIAKRNLTFNRGTQIIVSSLLVITIVFSCYGFSFIRAYNDDFYSLGYDYRLSLNNMSSVYSEYINVATENNGYSQENYHQAELAPYVSDVYGYKHCQALIKTPQFTDYMNTLLYANFLVYDNNIFEYFGSINSKNIDKIMTEKYDQYYLELKRQSGTNGELFPSGIDAFESSVISKLENSVIDGEINIDKLNSGEEVILAAPKDIAFQMKDDGYGGIEYILDNIHENEKGNNEKYLKTASLDYKAGDRINISVITADKLSGEDSEIPVNLKQNDKTVTIGAIISDLPDEFYQNESSSYIGNNMVIFTTLSAMNSFYPDAKYSTLNISAGGEQNDQTDQKTQESLKEISDSVYNGDLFSNYESIKEQKEYSASLLFAIVSLIILFMSISASIINNSLSASIREGKKEIGTLRAVGASGKDVYGSYIRILLSAFIKSYIIGFALFAISYAAITIINKSSDDPIYLKLSIWQTIIACVLLFAVCCVNLWLKIRKEMKNSIIDNIREL